MPDDMLSGGKRSLRAQKSLPRLQRGGRLEPR